MDGLRRRLTRAIDRRAIGGAEPGPYEIVVRRDLQVPMDDGVELLADLITPIDAPAGSPTILIRGPYGRRGLVAGSARALAYEGCTVIYQSCRGTFGSGGVFTPFVDEEADGLATHRWVRRQPWFTGTLVTYGPSYLGFTQWAVAGRLHREQPAEAPDALVLLITTPEFGDPTWMRGVFTLDTALGWTRMMDRITRGGASMMLMLVPDPKLRKALDVLPLSRADTAATGHPVHWYQDWIAHERPTDDYWGRMSHAETVPDVTAPVLMVTGWYDVFLPWQLRTYAALVGAGNQPRLTIGPWGHVSPEMAGPTHADAVAFLREEIGGAASTRPAPVRVFQTGAESWHELSEWPPAGVAGQEWFLQPGGGLDRTAAAGGLTSYVYEPNDPTPSVGGPTLGPETLPMDNTRHERRRDVLAFRSARLTAPVSIAGSPVARVRVRGSAASFDVFIRLTDVTPNGRVITVCDGIRRVGSSAIRADDPAPDDDGFREVEVELWPTLHQFAAGHRIGVQVSSGAHPRLARNPGTGEPATTAGRTVPSRQEISHDGPRASRVELPIWVR